MYECVGVGGGGDGVVQHWKCLHMCTDAYLVGMVWSGVHTTNDLRF